jgi:transmembrane sensor
MTRRIMLGGGAAVAAASAAYAIVNPPLGLWPALDEWTADYRTATGEQRRVMISDVTVEMNTQTSIVVPARVDGMDCIKLISGQASFALPAQPQRDLSVIAGSARIVARHGRFDVRSTGAGVDVTCTDGQLQIERGDQAVTVAAGSQLTYDDRAIGRSLAVDTAEATSWHEGFIIFRSTPLANAVAEINRYRPGRVILLNRALQATPISGRFQIARIDEVLVWIEQAAGARARALPGGIVLLS